MVHDAFISYSKKDKAIADAICKALESDGLSCWYAPRDVEIGADWDASIMDALANSRVMILVWSSNSDISKQVKREIAIALDDVGVSLIPFRTEIVEPSKLRYYLGNIQWLDASTPPLEDSLRLLIQDVRTAIARISHSIESAEQRIPPSDAEKTEVKEELAEAEAHRAEMEARQRAEEEARERAAEEARIQAAAETERLLQQKQAAEKERLRLAEEQKKADELERQRVEAEAQKRVQHAAQAALNDADPQRKLRQETPSSEGQPATSHDPNLRSRSGSEAHSRAGHASDFSSLDSYGSTPNERFPVQRVAIPVVALLMIVVAVVAYVLWPDNSREQKQSSPQAVAVNQTPTPEVPTPLPSAENKSESSSPKSSPTPRKVPTPGKSPLETTDPPLAKPTPPRAPLSGGVLNGKAVSLPRPAYPAIARQAHASGTVVVQVTIDEEGRVISARPVSGHPLLQGVAVEAARGARFSPTKLSGQRVKVTGVITYNFVAQ